MSETQNEHDANLRLKLPSGIIPVSAILLLCQFQNEVFENSGGEMTMTIQGNYKKKIMSST
jgi:hypothetical protein